MEINMIICGLYKENDSVSLEMKGHAGFAAEGSDIVCSAASILCYTLAAFLEKIPKTEIKKEMEKGDAYIEAEINKKNAETVNAAMDFVSVGFELLETAYPKNISVRKNF